MDVAVSSCRMLPYIDDKCYPFICFGCWCVPKTEEMIYGSDDEIIDSEGPFWDHKHLQTSQELVDQESCKTLAEAKRCVHGVKAAIKAAGLTGRKKPKPKKKPPYDITKLTFNEKKKRRKATK